MKYLIIAFLLFSGCQNLSEGEDKLKVDTIQPGKIENYYEWVIFAPGGEVAYQKKDSAFVILDSAATIKALVMQINSLTKELYGTKTNKP